MKKLLSLALASLVLSSAIVSCAPVPAEQSDSSSADALAKYTAYLEEHLGEMPDSLVISTAEDSANYGVDMTKFSSDGYFTRAENGEVVVLGKSDAGLDRAVRDYVKNGNSADYFTVYGEGYRVKKLTVAGNDISEYAVVRDDDADECQTFAASELVKYIEKTCGAAVPSYTASEYAAASDKPARTIRLTVDYPALGDEAFTVNIGDDANVTVSGGRYRGCMYGVYDLLEDIGWRFVNDAVDTASSLIEYLYESEHIDLTSALNRTESPAIAYRQIHGGLGSGVNSDIIPKYKANFSSASKYGGYGLTGVACHGLQNNHNRIFTNGEYDGLEDTGMQPCFTDEIILEAIDSYVIGFVKSRLDAGQQVGREIVTVDLSQWDAGEASFCTCKSCFDVFKEEGCTMGAVLRMGNRAASLLTENGYGGVNISLLAYNGTNKPPKKTEPLDNVRISYCIYVGSGKISCSNHSVSGVDCDPNSYYSNTIFSEELNAWSKICHNDNLDVWYYPFHCYGVAFDSPMYDDIYYSMIYLTNSSVNGMMYHSNYSSGGNLHSLITYVGAKMMWDNSITREEYYALIEEWFMIVYGDAGGNMYEYFSMAERADDMVGCWCAFHSPNTDKVNNQYMADNFDYMYNLFDEARDLADTAHQENLVERYMSGMLYMCIGITYDDRYTNGTDAEREIFAERYTEMHRIFRENNLRVVWDFITEEYAPAELDLETNPFDSWCTTWSN